MILETIVVGPFAVNCYIIASEANAPAIIIDPGEEDGRIKQALNKYKLKAGLIINTHGHIDHIGGDDKFGVPIYIHHQDLALLKDPKLNLSNFLTSSYRVKSPVKSLQDGEYIELEQMRLEVIHTPGHTPGGICLLMHKPENKVIFTGDTLFRQSIGRTDFSGSDERILIRSIKDNLLNLSDDTVIYPGHGPSSTIGEEKKSNPFLIDR